ncbi:DUF6153 family protein [Promicromonospora sp. NPDC057138]|uniref:DUF6153 family protein n=1 Tax=Promicromonospora sp. NPDC057138 TaxID=3346031 RepID=UPI00362C6C65
MRVISLLRSAVAEPGRRLNGALVILTLIIAVVTMHSMSGSPTAHHHGPHDASVVAMQESPTTMEPPGSAGECSDGCGGHDAAMAMCLMILVALLALVVPVRRLLWRAQPAWSVPPVRVAADLGAVAAPSLHELCISRT